MHMHCTYIRKTWAHFWRKHTDSGNRRGKKIRDFPHKQSSQIPSSTETSRHLSFQPLVRKVPKSPAGGSLQTHNWKKLPSWAGSGASTVSILKPQLEWHPRQAVLFRRLMQEDSKFKARKHSDTLSQQQWQQKKRKKKGKKRVGEVAQCQTL